MKRDIATWVAKCQICQVVKAEQQKPVGLLQPLEIPEWKWQKITLDFVVGMPRTQSGNDGVWVIVDRLTKSAHFLPIRMTMSLERLAELYIAEIVRLHGVPEDIVSDRDPRFTSRLWNVVQRRLGTTLSLSTAYHPQTDGQSERTIRSLEDLLRAGALEFGISWDKTVRLAEFTYNNSFHSSIGMAPFEALYGRKCKTPLCWNEVGEKKLMNAAETDFLTETNEQIRKIKDHLRKVQDRQKKYADQHRREAEFRVGDRVYLKVTPLKGVIRFGMRGKLMPRYVGPFEVLNRVGPIAYELALPPHMAGIHNVFHISMLRKCIPDATRIVELDPQEIAPDLTCEAVPTEVMDSRIKKLRNKQVDMFLVRWKSGNKEDLTWETRVELERRCPELLAAWEVNRNRLNSDRF